MTYAYHNSMTLLRDRLQILHRILRTFIINEIARKP